MYKNSFSLENRKENAVLASVHFIRFENAIKNFIPIFINQLWTVALIIMQKRKPVCLPLYTNVCFLVVLLFIYKQIVDG